MSRGGRGGFGRGASNNLPFDVDPELQEEIAKYGAEEKSNNGTDDRKAFLFPVSDTPLSTFFCKGLA